MLDTLLGGGDYLPGQDIAVDDTLLGGDGSDTFVLQRSLGKTRIVDFELWAVDRIA